MGSRFDAIRPRTYTPAKTTSAGSGQIRYVPANASATAAAKQNVINKSLATAAAPVEKKGVAIPSYGTNTKSIAMANAINEKIAPKTFTSTQTTSAPVQITPATEGPVQEVVPTPEPVQETAPEWSVYNDPFYLQQLQDAQDQFNMERINALGDVQYQEVGINRQLDERPATAEAARRRLAGNYASRGMAGGGYGALSRTEAEQNARELTARTSLRDQITELNRQFVGQFGAEGTDWLGTYRGSQAQNNAIQSAINNRLSGLTTVG